MTVNLGGEERVLDFSRFYFTKFYQKLVKENPDMTNADNLEAYIYSALCADCAFKKVPLPSREDVESWIGNIPNDEMVKIEAGIVSIMKPGEA